MGSEGRVVTFEPNPDNYARLRENLALNGLANVDARRLGISRQAGKALLVCRGTETGTGTLQEDLKKSIEVEDGHRSFEIEVDSLDHQIEAFNLPAPDFIKIDVEGLEMEVIQGMKTTLRDRKPALHIELHGLNGKWMRENARQVAEFLMRFGYSILHVSSGVTFAEGSLLDMDPVRWGHFYCTCCAAARSGAAATATRGGN